MDIPMEENGRYYYLELLYMDEKKRDQAYGRELLYDIIDANVNLSSLNPYEFLYKIKGEHITGKKKWFSPEKLPTIEMIIALYEKKDLDYLTLQTNFRVGTLKQITQGILTVSTISYFSKSRIESFNQELELICNSNELGIRKFQIITYKIFDSEGMLREKYYINGSIEGPIRKILVMNEYVKGRIECDNLRLTFH